ncbi:uncharacterized protein LOC122296936 [Carya illinoinensis]|uniref:uncharacterized protein LOC122296936 n=1 Tax=Carya illinoinensis TaxID=32201 RepID=UPI001C71D7EE|nr:uncharacterized protein LOC122296936 [Carya illinoinensis]
MFSIPVDSSSGPNGFGFGFYKSCWDIVETDVVAAVREFFLEIPMPRFYSASFIVLIPKMQKPNGFDKFRPISPCSVVYKVFSKILVRRLAPILNRIISPEQGAFLPGRSIFENISLAQEMIHLINKKVRGGNVVVKIDMAKAYNSIDWDFLIHVMATFGFSLRFCNLIRNYISTPWFLVVMNGTAKGFFFSGRGLRQGDPLLPYLFILVEEVLSRLLKHNFALGTIAPFSHPRGTPLVSHLLYAGNILLFANERRSSLQTIKDTFALYEDWFGQVVSKEKSSIFFSKHATATRKRSSLMLTSFSEGFFPVKYLGVPLLVGRLKVSHFDDLLNCIRRKLEGWQNRFLSSGAQLLLLRHVVASIPIHLLSGLHAPKAVMVVVNRIMSNFFFVVSLTENKSIAWNLLTGDSLWANFFKTKYLKDKHVTLVDHQKGTLFWKHVVGMVLKILAHSWWRGLVGESKMEEVLNCLGEQKYGNDLLIWKPNLNGEFSSKSTWDCVNVRAPKSEWASWIWHSTLPKKYSACAEDHDHVLANGLVAVDIWRCVSLQLGMPYDPSRSWKATMELWFRRIAHSTQKRTLLALVPIIVTWSLWVWRCKARWKATITWVGLRLRATKKMKDGDEKVLKFFSIPFKPVKRQRPCIVKWMKPFPSWFKLNVDGSSLENPGHIGASGLIRNGEGSLIWAFAKELGNESNNEAELTALFYGLQYCKDLAIQRVEIELDSLEGNAGADFLARWASSQNNGTWNTYNEVSLLLKGILKVDKIGLLAIRL